MILLGSSGFSYEDWKGNFYPELIHSKEMLPYYAKRFGTVEINSTYYAIPRPSAVLDMARRTPEDFVFTVKAHQSITHSSEPDSAVFSSFRRAIDPLVESGKLGCVLAQYPWSFKPSKETAAALEQLKVGLADLPVVVEFRNSKWADESTYSLLRKLDLGWCSVDEPALQGLMPRQGILTSSIAYLRFHGRNAAKWWKHEHAWQRYDYLYSEEGLTEWTTKVHELGSKAQTTFVFFNNHYRGKSAENARMFARMLGMPASEIPADQPSLF